MSEERKRILKMLAGGKINVEEADELLAALDPTGLKPAKKIKNNRTTSLEIKFMEGEGDSIEVNIPKIVNTVAKKIKETTKNK